MKTRDLRPNSRRKRFGKLDGRTFEAKLLRDFREQLVAHIGGAPNIAQSALIERAAWLNLRISMLDRKVIEGSFSEAEAKSYSALSSSLVRTLAALPAKPGGPADNPCYRRLANALDGFTGKIAAADVWKIVGKFSWDRRQSNNFQLGAAMRELGWTRTMARFWGRPESAYVKGTAAERRMPIYVFWDPATDRTFATHSTDPAALSVGSQDRNVTTDVYGSFTQA